MVAWLHAAAAIIIGWLLYSVVPMAFTFLRSSRALSKFPGPNQHWLWGNLPNMLARGDSVRCLHEWAQLYGTVYSIRLLFTNAVVITDPDVYSKFMRPGPDKLQKNYSSYAAFRKLTHPAVDNILTSLDNDHWRHIRKAVTPAFSMSNLRANFPHVVDVTLKVVDKLRQYGPTNGIDMDMVTQRLTVDVIGNFGFDRDLKATDLFIENRPLHVVKHILEAMQKRLNPLNRYFFWRAAYREFLRWAVEFDKLVGEMVSDWQRTPPADYTLAAHLLNTKDVHTGRPLSFAQLKSEVSIFWIAGFETTAHSIAWILFLLSTHPEAEAKLLAELRPLGLVADPVSPQPRALQWEDLSKLHYLNAVINEAMRLYPVVSSGTMRQVDRDITIQGKLVPRGSTVWVPFYAIQRSPRNWPDEPDAFKPERWLHPAGHGSSSTNGVAGAAAADRAVPGGIVEADADHAADVADPKAPRTAYYNRAYLPFSEGVRNCVGMALAQLEMRVAVATLLGHFHFELTPEMGGFAGVDADAKQRVTLRPEHGLMMYVQPRAG